MPNRDPGTGRFTSGGGGGGSGGGFNLGTAVGSVVIDTSGVHSAMQQARQAIDNGLAGIGDKISAIGDSMSRLGGALSTFSLPIIAAGGVGLKAAADFDVLLKQIEIFGNVAPSQLETVRQFALKMGADTKFSSSDAAAALLDLLKAGQSLDQAMVTLPDVLNLAAVGNMNLAQASGIVTSALAIFKLEAKDSARVSNALARAANASQADVGDLGQALTNVGPIAAMFGLSVEDTSAILGVFANNGIKGAEAGTQLKSMLLNLTRPTEDVKGAFEKLGVSLYDAQGNSRNFNTVIKELDGALDKLPVEEQNELMQTLGGSYGIVGLSALRASGGIDEMLASMAAAPEAGTVAASFMDTFRGKTESLFGSLETLMVSGLTPFMNDVAGPMVASITTVVNSITDWVNANPELTTQIVKVLAVIAALGPALLAGGKAISAVGTIVGIVASPIGLVGAALAGLYLAFQNNFLGIRDVLQPFIDNIVYGFNILMQVIGEIPYLMEHGGIVSVITLIINSFAAMFGLIDHSGDSVLPGLQTFVQGVVDGFNSVISFVQTEVLPALQKLANWFLTTALPAVLSFIQSTVIPGIQAFFTFLGEAWAIVGPVLGQLFDWFVTTALPAVVGFIRDTVIPGVQKFIDILVKVWNDVSPFLTSLANWFTADVLPTVVHYIEDVVIPGVQKFIDILVGIWGLVQPELTELYDWFITNGLPFIQEALRVIHDDFIKPFVDILAGIMIAVGPILEELKNWFVTTGLPEIQKFIQGAMDNFINPLINLLKGLWDAVKPGVEGVYNWFKDTFSKIGQFIQPIVDLIQSVIDKASQALDWLRQLGGGAPAQTPTEIVQSAVDSANITSYGGFGTVQPLPPVGGGSSAFPTMDRGGFGMAGRPYQIGSPQLGNEIYIPGADGQFVPNFFDKLNTILSGGASGQPITINVTPPESALLTPAAAQANGQILGEAIKEEMLKVGFKGRF